MHVNKNMLDDLNLFFGRANCQIEKQCAGQADRIRDYSFNRIGLAAYECSSYNISHQAN
jgi:hypothetical protein